MTKLSLLMLLMLFSCSVVLADTYKIGVLIPLSGNSAEKGIPLKNAAELFIDKYNKANQNNIKLELLIKDDFDDPEKAKIAATEMVKDDSLLAVIGHYYPTTASATAQIFNDAKIPFMSPWVSSPEMLEDNQWAFMLNVTENEQGAFIATYVKEVLKKDNVLLIHNTGKMGINIKQAFMDKADNIGLNVLKTLSVERELKDKDWVAKNLPDTVENEKFGIVVSLTRSETGLVFLTQLRDHGIKQPLIATLNWMNDKFFDLDDKYTDNVFVTAPFLWEIASDNASRFTKSYANRYQKKPTLASAMAWDSILLLSKSIEALNESKTSPSRSGIRDFLSHLDWQDAIEGVTGLLYFKNKNDKTSEYVAKYFTDMKKETEEAAKKVAQETTESNKSTPQKTSKLVLQKENKTASLKDTKAVAPATSTATIPTPAPTIKVQVEEGRNVMRELFVAQIVNDRFKVSPIQLARPHEEYVLKELTERVKKGYIKIIDNIPYHIIDVVFVGVDVIRITDVNIKDMTWNVDLFMWFKWTGNRLEVKDIEKIVAINAVKEESVLFMENIEHESKYRSYKKRLTLNSPFDLSTFPFDTQMLQLSIGHMNKNSTHLMLGPDVRHMDNAPINSIKPQEWTYQTRDYYSDLYRYESTFGNPVYRMIKGYKSPIYFSTIKLEIYLKRILQPYAYTFFLPLFIILGINIMLVFWIPVDQFAPRINATLSALVGILLYHMSQKNSFPKVGYTMIADYYFLLAYMVVVIMIFSNMKTQQMMSAGQKDQAKAWNRRMSISALMLSISVYGILTVWSIYLQDFNISELGDGIQKLIKTWTSHS